MHTTSKYKGKWLLISAHEQISLSGESVMSSSTVQNTRMMREAVTPFRKRYIETMEDVHRTTHDIVGRMEESLQL